MVKFRFARLAVMGPVAALAVWATPLATHAAAPSGHGVVNGDVTLNPGLPTTGCAAQAVTFNSFQIQAIMLNDGAGNTYTGGMVAQNVTAQSLTDNVSGSGCETLQSGAGTVNAFTATSSDGVTVICNLHGNTGTDGYTRSGGGNVTVNLSGSCTIKPGTTAVSVTIVVNAAFNPTSANPVKSAKFTGQFTVS